MTGSRYVPGVAPRRELAGGPVIIHLVPNDSGPIRALCGQAGVDLGAAPRRGDRGCAKCLAAARAEMTPEERVAFDAIAAGQRSLR